jgi:glutathione S-transferase
MKATLFGIPSSHPTLAAQLMLERKGIDYRRRDLVAGVSRPILRALGFKGITVPAIKLDGQRFQGTREIALALDALQPEPPLLPRDPELRAAVERAEAWGDEALQPVPRRISWAALKRDRSELKTYLEGARLGIPVNVAALTAGPVVALAARLNKATNEAVERDLAALPGLIDRIEELLDEGVLGSDEPNVADYQIATSMRLLLTFDDLQPLLAGRPAALYAQRMVPSYPGHTSAVLPSEWLPPGRGTQSPAATA